MNENIYAPQRLHRRGIISGVLAGGVAAAAGWALPRHGAKSVRYVRPEEFGAKGNGVTDDAQAFRAACLHCAATGDQLRLSRRHYPGARIEVHGSFDVLGEGATIDYLGIGNTLISGTGQGVTAVATAWPRVDRDAYAERFPVQTFILARDARQGHTELVLSKVGSLQVGDQLFLARKPTSMSSQINYIPSEFSFAKVERISGNNVMVADPLEWDFHSGDIAFISRGTAINCNISDLTISTDVDAYQHVLRSGINIVLERITFAGKSAVGSCTFADGITYRDCRALRAYGPLSTARGCGRILIDGFTFAPRRTPPTAQPYAIFLEESLRNIEIRRVDSDGAGFSIRMIDMARTGQRGRVLIDHCRFRSDNAVEGATGAFQGGVAIGLDIDVKSTVFRGVAIRPDSHQFPGVDRRALTWMATTGGQDRLSFTDCTFESVNGGAAIATGSGFQGRLQLDRRTNRFIGCQPPS